MEEGKKLIDEINDNFGIYLDNPKNQDTMIVVESIAICFQALVDEIRALRETIESDQNPINPVFR